MLFRHANAIDVDISTTGPDKEGNKGAKHYHTIFHFVE